VIDRIIIPLDREYIIENILTIQQNLNLKKVRFLVNISKVLINHASGGFGQAPGDSYFYHINEGKHSHSVTSQKIIDRFKSSIAIDKSVTSLKTNDNTPLQAQ
jgi:hypothetical protein